jgi:hypothetical protein
MAAFCAQHSYPGRRSPAELLARLNDAPGGTTDQALTRALRDTVLALVTVLRAANAAVKDLSRSAVAHLGEHPDGKIFTSRLH